jgi:hypothetical protein
MGELGARSPEPGARCLGSGASIAMNNYTAQEGPVVSLEMRQWPSILPVFIFDFDF